MLCGGGILIYVRQDIPSNQLKKHNFAANIERIFIEANLRIMETPAVPNDPIESIILKYSNHPSIILINKNVKRGMFSFNKVSLVDVRSVTATLDVKKASACNSISSKIYQGIQ